jgi:hypothetical protein
MSAQDCRSADWYGLGYRDADLYGLQPQIDQYAHQCQGTGVAPQHNAYMAGWVDGYAEFKSRMEPNDGL